MTTTDITQPVPVRRSWLVSAAVADLAEGLGRWELWSTLGWHDIRQRYRRSVIGPFWLTLSMGLTIGGLAYLYAGLFGQRIEEYLPYVAIGMIVFNFISALVTDGSTVFFSAGRVILQIKAPLSLYVYQVVWKNILMFAHNISIYIVLVIALQMPVGWSTLLALCGLFLVVL